MSNITLFQSDHSCENIYKDQKTKKLSVVNSPYIFSDWDWMKLFNVKRSYILSMVIHLKEWYFSLNWKMTTSTLLKIVYLHLTLLISGEVWKGGCFLSLMAYLLFFISTSNYVTILLSSYSLFVVSFNWIHSLFSLEFVIPLSGLELQYHALALTIKYTSFK